MLRKQAIISTVNQLSPVTAQNLCQLSLYTEQQTEGPRVNPELGGEDGMSISDGEPVSCNAFWLLTNHSRQEALLRLNNGEN